MLGVCVCGCVCLFHATKCSDLSVNHLFSPLDPQATRESSNNRVCLLNAKHQRQVARGGSGLCVNTKPNYLPIVHLQDGESRVLCQLLFLFFRRVRVLKQNKKDRCVHIYFGEIVQRVSHVRCNAGGWGFNNKHICSVKKKYIRQYLGYFVNSLSVQ